jgi:hypothetical protein
MAIIYPPKLKLPSFVGCARLVVLLVFGCVSGIKASDACLVTAAESQTNSDPRAFAAQHGVTQEERWKELEIQRYSPNGRKDLMQERGSDYVKLVLVPLLLFILALAIVRLNDF